MSVSKFNNEGYYDPVVYEALTKVEAEERQSGCRLPSFGLYMFTICRRY